MTPAETATVRFTVMRLERVTGHGGLIAFAAVEADLDGIVVTIDGVGVVRSQDGRLFAQAPRFRGSSGEWRPAIGLPAELAQAMGEEVLQAFAGMEEEQGHG
jgi:DNA-binding cell septation regulator SpoVG